MYKSLLLILCGLLWPVYTSNTPLRHRGVILRHGTPGVRLGLQPTGTPPRDNWSPIRKFILKKYGDYIAELELSAIESRRITQNVYPDKSERGIRPVDRLYRVAMFAIKKLAPPEDLNFAQKWLDWWKTVRAPLVYDVRSIEDRFFAYTVERQLGAIAETDEIKRFEKLFDEEYMDFLKAESANHPTLTITLDPEESSLSFEATPTLTIVLSLNTN